MQVRVFLCVEFFYYTNVGIDQGGVKPLGKRL